LTEIAPAGASDAFSVVDGSVGMGAGVGARVGDAVAAAVGDDAAVVVADDVADDVAPAGLAAAGDTLAHPDAIRETALARARIPTHRSGRSARFTIMSRIPDARWSPEEPLSRCVENSFRS
jgi:hypothetical protein